jgi:hypothetical protein
LGLSKFGQQDPVRLPFQAVRQDRPATLAQARAQPTGARQLGIGQSLVAPIDCTPTRVS